VFRAVTYLISSTSGDTRSVHVRKALIFKYTFLKTLTLDILQILFLRSKVIPQQTEVAQGVPGRLRPRIFLMFGTTRVAVHQPYAPAAFTPGEIPGTQILEAESTPLHMVPSVATGKIPSD